MDAFCKNKMYPGMPVDESGQKHCCAIVAVRLHADVGDKFLRSLPRRLTESKAKLWQT